MLECMQPASLEDMLRRFGKREFRPMQRELMECALAGRSCIGVLPTGSGKSLCYQIPAMMMEGVSVVVSPLIALMRDQVAGLEKLGMAAARYDSSLDDEEKARLLAAVKGGGVRLLFAAPESLSSPWMAEALAHARRGMLVIDEAHCLSEWGHSFRPDYLALPDFFSKYGFRSVMALTATATERVRNDLARLFDVAAEDAFQASPYRGNITRHVETLPEQEKTERLSAWLHEEGHRPAVVYVRTRKDAESLSFDLGRAGFAVKSYHAGMPAETRALVQDEFLEGRAEVLVATIAFGMGIDKADVRSVVHYHPPASLESYVQESGRAGRDGLDSLSLVMLSPEDATAVENRIRASLPDLAALRGFFQSVAGRGRHVVSFYEACSMHDLAEPVLARALFDLKRRGMAGEEGAGHKYYKVKPLFPLEEIQYGRLPDEVAHLAWLAAHRDGSVEDAALALGMEWASAEAWLLDLMEGGEWKVDLRQSAVLLRVVDDVDAGAEASELHSRFVQGLERDLARWRECRAALTGSECLNRGLNMYFGFPEGHECGHCPSCTGETPGDVEASVPAPLSGEQRGLLLELAGARKPALLRPGQMARFLLGLASPASMRARLWGHPLYGAMASHAWDDVWAEARAVLGV